MRNYKVLIIPYVLLLITSFIYCDTGSDDKKDDFDPTKGSVRITLPGGTKSGKFSNALFAPAPLMDRVLPLNSPDNILRYELSLTSSELNYIENKTANRGETIIFTKLFEGHYSLSVTAFDSAGIPIFGGTNSNIVVIARLITDATVVLRDLIGDTIIANSPPWAPWDLQYVISGLNQVNLTWEDNSVKEDGYRVYKMIQPEYIDQNTVITWDCISGNLLPDTMAFSDFDYTATTQQTWYRVCAYNGIGESNFDAVHFPEGVVTQFDATDANFDECLFEK